MGERGGTVTETSPEDVSRSARVTAETVYVLQRMGVPIKTITRHS